MNSLVDFHSIWLAEDVRFSFIIEEYTSPKMQSPVKIQVLCQMQYAVMQGCVGLRDAMKCIEMHLRGYAYSHVELLT